MSQNLINFVSALFVTFLALALSPLLGMAQDGRCAMRGTCGYKDYFLPVPCPVDEPPASVSVKAFETLAEICPELVAEYGNNLCCSDHQISELAENMNVPRRILAVCPACYQNFRQSFCHFACSPNQRQFMNVTETHWLPSEPWDEDGTSPLIESVKTTEFFITRRYVEGTYESCKGVLFIGGDFGYPAMNFLCGPWAACGCSAEKWFEYMGSPQNDYAPFKIIYKLVEIPLGGAFVKDALIPFHYDTHRCDKPLPGDMFACRCSV